jgi:hypothetical protein
MASPATPNISASLLEYIEKVWTAFGRDGVNSANDVYDLYCESNLPRTDTDYALAEDYGGALLELWRIGGAGCELQWQRGEDFEQDPQTITGAFTAMIAEARNRSSAGLTPVTAGLLKNDFVMFINTAAGGGIATERIYIHLNPPIPANGFKVMQALLGMFPANAGLRRAKICAACATDRLDSIVVFLTDDSAARSVVDQLGSNPALNGCFARGVPLVVNEVMPGIGRAQEPPRTAPLYADDGTTKHPLRVTPTVDPNWPGFAGPIRFATKPNSFGGLHSDLISAALARWCKNNPAAPLTGPVPPSLLGEIAAVYRKHGYDPANPSQFPNRREIEAHFQDKMSRKFFDRPVAPGTRQRANTA